MRALSLLFAVPAVAFIAQGVRAEPPVAPAPVSPTIVARAPEAKGEPAGAVVPTSATAQAKPVVPVAPAAAETRKAARPAVPATTLTARIDLTTQRLEVSYDGRVQHVWPISSGREGFATPRGSFRPQWTAKMWYSRKYDNAPMPHAVFFTGGVAVHGTQSTRLLGQPASHGCVRLAPANAARFYALVHKHGLKQTRIVVQGTPPAPRIARAEGARLRPGASRPDVRREGAGGNVPLAWSSPRLAAVPRGPAQPVVRMGPGGVVHLPAGSPYRGRESFVLNGVTYVRVR
jgi:lipoprotein-anchoring transpeptidase ErfK/SrfK